MKTNVIEINLPTWLGKTIEFFVAMYYWINHPATMFNIAFKDGWIPLKVCKQIKFKDLDDGTTVFKHDTLPGEFKVNYRADYENPNQLLAELFTFFTGDKYYVNTKNQVMKRKTRKAKYF